MSKVERRRAEFKPPTVRVLFVGESAPASGNFFYFGNTALARYTQRAFEKAFDRTFSSEADFLLFFKTAGCWLDDISRKPVNRLDHWHREVALRKSLPYFSERLKEISPNYIVVVLKKIARHVDRAVDGSGLKDKVKGHQLPFPGYGRQELYVKELASILREAGKDGIRIVAHG